MGRLDVDFDAVEGSLFPSNDCPTEDRGWLIKCCDDTREGSLLLGPLLLVHDFGDSPLECDHEWVLVGIESSHACDDAARCLLLCAASADGEERRSLLRDCEKELSPQSS